MPGDRLTSVVTVHEEGSWVFTASDAHGDPEEVVVVPCDTGVEAWINRCTHEAQRLDTGRGAAIRDGEIVCPRHGSLFDACTGACDNGEAAGTWLVGVAVTVEDGDVYLDDPSWRYLHPGGIEDGDDDAGPTSTSHLSF